MKKTIKIEESTHRALLRIKAYWGYKTIDETIDMCIGEFNEHNFPGKERKYQFDDK